MKRLLLFTLALAVPLLAADNYFLPINGNLDTPANWSLGVVPGLEDTAYVTNQFGTNLWLSGTTLSIGNLVVLGTTSPYHNTTHTLSIDKKSLTVTGTVVIGNVSNRGARLTIAAGSSLFVTNDNFDATIYLGSPIHPSVSVGQVWMSTGSTCVVDRIIAYANQPGGGNLVTPFQGPGNVAGYVHLRKGAHLIGGNIQLPTFLQTDGTTIRTAGWASAGSEILVYNRFILTGTNTVFINRMNNGGLRPLQHNTTIIISNGATFVGDNSTWESRVIAPGRAYTNSLLVVTHNGSITSTAGVALGPSAANNETLSFNNRMIVTDGGRIFSRYLDVGGLLVQNVGGDGRANLHSAANLAIVTNGGSCESFLLRVGFVGATGQYFAVSNNILLVAAGGLVTATNAFVGVIHNPARFFASTNYGNRIVVDGGTFKVDNAANHATLVLRHGRLVCRAGLAEVDRLQILDAPEATVEFEGGTLQVNNATTNDNGTTFTVADGTLHLAAGNHNFVSGLQIGTDGVLKGNGKVIGNVTCSGTISPGASIGYLPIVGNVTVADQGTLVWELDTTTNDILAVTGDLTFQGEATLVVSALEPMSPPAEPRSILTVSGTFTPPTSWNFSLPSGWNVANVSFENGVLSLQLVPEPTALLLPLLLFVSRRMLAR